MSFFIASVVVKRVDTKGEETLLFFSLSVLYRSGKQLKEWRQCTFPSQEEVSAGDLIRPNMQVAAKV